MTSRHRPFQQLRAPSLDVDPTSQPTTFLSRHRTDSPRFPARPISARCLLGGNMSTERIFLFVRRLQLACHVSPSLSLFSPYIMAKTLIWHTPPLLPRIDLSMAYNGLSAYNFVLVGIQTFLSNFWGPILWSLARGTLLLPALPRRSESPSHSNNTVNPARPFATYLVYASAFHSVALAAIGISATVFRNHLFTWTVFSPAVLYKIVWSVLVHWVASFVSWSISVTPEGISSSTMATRVVE
jgi:hypothetical protein